MKHHQRLIERQIDRLEKCYDFECEAGSLKYCRDWQMLKDEVKYLYLYLDKINNEQQETSS